MCGRFYTKNPPQVVTRATHISFLIWPKRDPMMGSLLRFGLIAMPQITPVV
jgi:hypothetical protein